jgi:hypothetical protein
MPAPKKNGIDAFLTTWRKLEEIAENPKKSIKARQAALSKIAVIQQRWDATLSRGKR